MIKKTIFGLLTLSLISFQTQVIALKNSETNLNSQEINSLNGSIEVSQNIPFELDGQPVYVLRNNTWQEAHLRGYNWDSRTGVKYTVYYVETGETENDVSVDRIRSLASAQQQGVATNVYDLSNQADVVL